LLTFASAAGIKPAA